MPLEPTPLRPMTRGRVKEGSHVGGYFAAWLPLGTKGLSGINRFEAWDGWSDRIVPFAVEIAEIREALHFLVRYDGSLWIGFVVEFASNRQAVFGGRRADQFDDDAIAYQRFGAPVLGNE